ncbi:MAG: hypothetical protein Q9179_006922 [Wetmoreana sp. 5 TL-2023]
MDDRKANSPGLDRAPGSMCYRAGPWVHQQRVLELADYACVQLTSRALTWVAQHNNSLANPDVRMERFFDGSPFKDNDGTPRTLTFLMLDVNGEKGRPWYGKDQCVLAIQTLIIGLLVVNGVEDGRKDEVVLHVIRGVTLLG